MSVPLAAALAKHKAALLGAGAAGAVVLGLRAQKGKGATVATTARPSGTYDSTANDLYNAIQPQIDALAAQLSAMGNTASSPQDALNPVSPIPPPTLPAESPLTPTQLSTLHSAGVMGVTPAEQGQVAADLEAHPGGGSYWISSANPDVFAAESVLSAPPGHAPKITYRTASDGQLYPVATY